MANVTIKTGKTVKVGSRSKSGGYTYEVQADGSIKNLTTGRITSPATGKAMKTAAPAPKAKAAPVPAPRIDRKAATPVGPAKRMALGSDAKPTGPARRAALGSNATPTGPAKRATLGPADTSVTVPTGPQGRGGRRGPKPVVRPVGFTKKKRTGGIFGLDIIKGN